MSFPSHVWDQLRNLTADELIQGLRKDGWNEDVAHGSIRVYKKGNNRVDIHYHPCKTFGPKLLKGLLGSIGWSINDLKRLKLIK